MLPNDQTTTMVRLETFLVVLTMVCVIAANDSAIKNLYDPATTITQVGATETDNTGPAKVFDEELDRKFHAEYRSLQSSERLQHQHDDDRGFLKGYVKCRNDSVSITRHAADSIRSRSLENESPKETFDAFVMDETNEKGDHHMPNVSFAKRMGGVDNVMPPAKQIKSKPLHFSQQDQDIGDVVLYRPKNRSHDGYQRSRILVQKNLEEDRHSGTKLNSDVPGSAGISGRLQDVHQGQSLFYDSSAELVGVASEDIPVKIVPIETKVLPDDCEGQNDNKCSTLAPPEKRNATTTLLNSTMLPFETRVTGEHPEWSTVLSALNATESGIRLAKTVLHYDSEEHPEHKNGPKQNSREVIESRSSNSKPARGRNRASSGRSLFKLLAGQQYSDIFNGSNNKNTTTDATIDKENKMNPFRFGLQQLFTPRLPMARLPGYPQMITYAPQYRPVGSLLYPTRTPMLPLYTTTALLPITAHMASSTTAISTARTPLQDPVTLNAASNNNNKPITTDPAKCSGECVDVFAALMCKRVDEEAKCALSNQRCCVGGAEQMSKFRKRHGSLAKKKKIPFKKYQKKYHRAKESASSSLNIGAGHTGSVEIAIEEDGHEQDYADVQKFFLHSKSPASLTFSKESTTKRPAIIQLSSDNRLVQVIGPKDQLWTTRYPEIPKYVTIVTTTSRPFKPLRQHATRRMDSYSDGQSMESTLVYESEHSAVNESTHSTQEEPRSFTRKPKNQQQNNSHDGDDRQHAGTASVSEHELEMIESGVHQIKALPPSKRKSQQESDHKKSQKRPFASGVSQDNNIDDERKYHDLPEQEVAEEEPDTSTDDTPSTTKPLDKEFPLCPGNCVMPLFSLFCDPEFKSHACDVPGRVCCVGASMKPNGAKQNGPASETTSNSAQTVAEETPNTNDGHDRECPGRCVTAFFQYTCRHPFKITDDICPIGSLCCSEKSPPSQANTEDNHQHGSANEASKKSGEQHGVQNDMQEYQHDAAESTKNKLNLIHSFLTTVLSTKRPKRRPSGIENVSADTFHSSSRPLNNFIDEVLQADETRMRPNYAVPYEPKFFPMNDVQTEGSSTSEDGSDPPEVVIEPAIPTRPTLDTSFSQLDRPPSKLVLSEFTPLKNAPFHEHHRAPHIKEDTSKRKEIDSPPLRYRGYPKGPESAHPRPPSVRQDHSHHRGIVSTVARPDDGSQENARIRPPHMDLRRYQPGLPPYRRFRPLPPPSPLPSPFLSLNSSSTSNSHLFEDDLLSSSHEENNHVHEAELSLEETEHKELPQLTASTMAEVTAEGNLTNPFVSVWTPTNINSARVKEVNAMSSTLPEEQTIKVIGNGVHPSSCGLNGFHIKRGSDRHSFRTAKLGEWCWQAAIVDSEDRLLCSGAVIGAQWILTSASCLVRANFTTPVSPQTSGLRAKIGYVDLKGSAGGFTHGPMGSQTKTVSMVYSHHNFNAERRDNDVALLKLHDFIDLNGVVCIICLPSTIRPERAVENCTVTAYRYESRRQSSNGVAFENNSNVSADKVRLTYERVSKLDPQVCTDLAALRNHSQLFTFALNGSSVSSVSRSKFCAGDVDKGERIATCKPKPNLDSETVDVHIYQTEQTEQGIDVVGLGNPLVCRIDDEFYQLSGLSSMFLGCSSPASPTVFTNLAYFTGWINQITNVNRYS